MNRDNQKKYLAIFMFVMFFGSTFAMALTYVMPSETKTKYIFDEPLQDSDEAYFFKQNMIVVRVYYDQPVDTIDTLANLINVLNQKMALERININQYPEVYDYMKDKFPIQELPMILLRGRQEVYLNGEYTKHELLDQICPLYFETIDECLNS